MIKSIPVLSTLVALITINMIISHALRLTHRNSTLLLFSFLFYSLIALLIFYAQLITLPEWDGLSGPEGGIGTDDTFFYTQATDDFDMSRNGAVKAFARMDNLHTYSNILRQCVRIISLYKTPELLDLLLINAYVLAFVPFFCVLCFRIIASYSQNESETSGREQIAYWLVMLHPSLWTDGLILIRDGWTATLFIAALLALLYSQLFRCTLAVLLLSYIRLASGISFSLCAIPLALPVAKHKYGKHAPFFILGVAGIGVAIMLYAAFSGYLENKDISFGRDDYVEGFIARANDQKEGGSVLYAISNLPILLRIPASVFFFLCAPFIRLNFSNAGILIPRVVLASIAGGFNILLLKWWVQSLIKSWHNWRRFHSSSWISLHAAYIIAILLIATMSLQMRHKTMILPLLCILAAHGVKDCDAKTIKWGNVASASLAAVNIMNLFVF